MALQTEGISRKPKTQSLQDHFPAQSTAPLPWIQVAQNTPYFITDTGKDWTPIGQNDAITWPELKGLFRRNDLKTADTYLRMLSQHGVTCLRLMLEYCHGNHRYFEKPVGRFQPNMIALWDDLFYLCNRHGLRVLLTPYDTFWMRLRWSSHPYKKSNGGPCERRSQWLLCADTRAAIKQRLLFATERWGGSGTLFAWDLWNEIHPLHGGNSTENFATFIEDIGSFLRKEEERLHGRAHLQTVSLFGPVLNKDPQAADAIFRHPSLDFASIHFYEKGTIDHPKNTVAPAISTGRLTREALLHIKDNRPFFDSEHGPIHTFKDRRKTLPEAFDNEYFRHMQWAHFASGGAGGGMRWPNRHPHTLTTGMRIAQQALAQFLPLINWQTFQRRNLEIEVSNKALTAFGCGDDKQVILWLLRNDSITKQRTLDKNIKPISACVHIAGLSSGNYRIIAWDTTSGTAIATLEIKHTGAKPLGITVPPITTDLAFAVQRLSG